MIGIGHGNAVQASQVVAVLNPASAPVIRLRAEARKGGRLVDASQGRKTLAVLVMASGHVIESALDVKSLTDSFNRAFRKRSAAEAPAAGDPDRDPV
jgi:regulator of extracellular matrix RemA (YlzA/DUF370 family)